MNFSEDARLHNALNKFVEQLLYNNFTGNLWDIDFLNSMDREELGEQFASSYISEYANEFEDDNSSASHLSVYAAKQIDRLIPRLYFLESNKDLSTKYTPLLARRVYEVKGKDGFSITANIRYQFDHDFTDENKMISETTATEKQIAFLQKLGKAKGYLLWHEEYLSKTYANQMITYLDKEQGEEPTVFSFFFVSK